ncbi:MAG TPA: DUF4033 domain-containing protein, partial [Candidatus Obscuribacterales bacterium]
MAPLPDQRFKDGRDRVTVNLAAVAARPIAAMQTQATPTEYHDGLFARIFIRLFSGKMARAVGQKTPFSGYDGFVDLSKKIMQGRNAQEQQALVAVVLRSLVPAPVLWLIRHLFAPTQLVCELNAWFATQLFEWLVGPCEVTTVTVPTANGQSRSQKSGVHIQKCRYLEQSRCVGMCVNMCKLPTQQFFTQDFGIPLTMTPNFEDFSCEMVFGAVPPPLETEDCYHTPCLVQE